MRRVNVEMLVGSAEVAEIVGLTKSSINYLARTDPTFPEPVHHVRATPLWLAPEIENWKLTRKKRKSGRKSLKDLEAEYEAAVRALLGRADGRQDPGRKAD
jgi:predicted DNA-binding transcriptional regulator AlpA